MKTLQLFLFLSFSVILLGCSEASFDTAPVSGTVTSGDTLVPDGTIVFSPQASGKETMIGKPATGAIKDGKFVLSTYGDGDGAVIGTHKVMVTGKKVPPSEPGEVEWGAAPNWGSTTETFTVVAGQDNTFDIKLTPPQKKRGDDEEEDD